MTVNGWLQILFFLLLVLLVTKPLESLVGTLITLAGVPAFMYWKRAGAANKAD